MIIIRATLCGSPDSVRIGKDPPGIDGDGPMRCWSKTWMNEPMPIDPLLVVCRRGELTCWRIRRPSKSSRRVYRPTSPKWKWPSWRSSVLSVSSPVAIAKCWKPCSTSSNTPPNAPASRYFQLAFLSSFLFFVNHNHCSIVMWKLEPQFKVAEWLLCPSFPTLKEGTKKPDGWNQTTRNVLLPLFSLSFSLSFSLCCSIVYHD